jgi:hypothetical protein
VPEVLSVEKVVRIAERGEGFVLNGASVPLRDLLAIATAARGSRGLVRFRGLTGRPLEDLMRITVASQGRVIIEEDDIPTASPPIRRGWFVRRPRAPARPPLSALVSGAASREQNASR